MAGQSDKLKIGLFVVVSLLLGTVFLIWLGASRYLAPSQTVVAYFSESVQGLEQDSPVKFRGVNVGRVYSIRMAPDARLVEVVMALERNFKVTDDLGVKTSLLGLTGMKYLEMDRFKPNQKRESRALEFKPPYPVITTYPSNIREFGNALENILSKVKTVDMHRISTHLINVSAKLDRMLDTVGIEKTGAEAAEAVREIKKAAKKFNEEMDKLRVSHRVGTTLDKTSELLKEVTRTARSAEKLITRTDNNINRLSMKLDKSADNLVELTHRLKSKPSSIIFGFSDKDRKKER